MSIALISNFECYKLTLCPQWSFFADRLASAKDILEGIREYTEDSPIWLSDMLPHNYLYKPISLDMIEVESDEEYKALKNIKKAKYIHTCLLDNMARPDKLKRDVMNGEIVLSDCFITSAFEEEPEHLKKEIHPEFLDPIVYSISEKEMFDIYIASLQNVKDSICNNKQLLFSHNQYDLLEVKTVSTPKQGHFFILQADYAVRDGFKIEHDSDSLFRVRISDDTQQYFKAGSVFDVKDSLDMELNNEYYPFVLFAGGEK